MTRRIHRKKPPPPPLVFDDPSHLDAFMRVVEGHADNPGLVLGVVRDRAIVALRASGIDCELDELGAVRFLVPRAFEFPLEFPHSALAHLALWCSFWPGRQITAADLGKLREAAHAVYGWQAHIAVATVEAQRGRLNDIAPAGGAKMKKKAVRRHKKIAPALDGQTVKAVTFERAAAGKKAISERTLYRIKKAKGL